MSKPRLEWKVGLFVLISLVLLGAMIMRFSKGTSFFVSTYQLTLVTPDVGGIRSGARVLMAGVPIGDVHSIELEHGGKKVMINAKILRRYEIHADARFTIQQVGVLGDQIIAVIPARNDLPVLVDGDVVDCEPPLNLGEMVKSTAGLLVRVNETVGKVNLIVARVDESILAEQALTNLASTIANFRLSSERALSTLEGIDNLVHTNAHPLTVSISNLVLFSDQLNHLTAQLQETLTTNQTEITAAIKNIESASLSLDKLFAGIEEGQGLAGSLLKDPAVQDQFEEMVFNFSILSSNLNAHGIFWKPRQPRILPRPLYPGKNPFQ
jgi:phospholipid/cholesterol/gamma-HCH transport system substrate-binding protein